MCQKSEKKTYSNPFSFEVLKCPDGVLEFPRRRQKERVKKPKCWTRFLQIKWGICSTRGCLEQPDCQFIIEENSHWFLHFFSSKKDLFACNQNIFTFPQFPPKRVPYRDNIGLGHHLTQPTNNFLGRNKKTPCFTWPTYRT